MLLRDGRVGRNPTIEQLEQLHPLLSQHLVTDPVGVAGRQANDRHVDRRGEERRQHQHLQHVHLAPAIQLHAHNTPGLIREVPIPKNSKIAQPISSITEARLAAE